MAGVTFRVAVGLVHPVFVAVIIVVPPIVVPVASPVLVFIVAAVWFELVQVSGVIPERLNVCFSPAAMVALLGAIRQSAGATVRCELAGIMQNGS